MSGKVFSEQVVLTRQDVEQCRELWDLHWGNATFHFVLVPAANSRQEG